jgi:uncharacterized sulfatase
MVKRIIVIVLALLVIGGFFAWINRVDLALWAYSLRKPAVAQNRAIAWAQGPATAPTGERAPNIIFILADDLGYNDISTFGGGIAGGRLKTPNIDALAASGAIFTQSYSGTATCAPSRAMLMTGRYPTRTGFEFTPTPNQFSERVAAIANANANGPPTKVNLENLAALPTFAAQGLPNSEVTIAEVLKQRGYHTVHIGKWHLGFGKEFGPNAQGFDEALVMTGGLFLPENDNGVVNAKLPFDPIDRFLWASQSFSASFNESPHFKPGGYLTDYWTDESIKVIKANKHRPFFLNLSHWAVHTPLQATREDYEAVGDIAPHRLRVYAAMMRALDRSVGAIMQAVRDEGLADNTLIIFSSDNGGPGYIGYADVNKPFRGFKATLFEGGLRVPLFMSWQGMIAPGTQVAMPAAHIDLMPTMAAAAGAKVPEGVELDGMNLLPLARGVQRRERAPIFFSSGYYRAVRAGDWKLQVTEKPKPRTWLFNLKDDPTERNDLSASQPAKRDELLALLEAHHKNARPPLYPYTIEGPIMIDKSLDQRFKDGDEYIYWPN